ncbi:TPA: TnsA endonuclease N-terminal domain-containing protein [Pseudomonas aeruginosa]|nr:TnsA endonuclease N-terminal domain-containing protein [Pseudomonas aeruginosa]HCF6119514.1 TnsA endonuclease N-terminal domain-containing protein [Pseudomonas aeruginosa]
MSLATLPCTTNRPSRQIIRKGHRNFAHFFPSIKNGRSIGCESFLESEYCFLLEYDREVVCYHEQPHCFDWRDAEQKYRYTPDFLVHRRDGSCHLIEVKIDFDHLNETSRQKLASFSAYCQKRDWTYQQWSMADIHNHSNLDTLKYLYCRAHHIDAADKFFFAKAVQHFEWPITLGQLLHTLPQFSTNLVCHLLFFQILHADLKTAISLDLQIDGVESHGQLTT